MDFYLEITAVILGLIYLLLLIKERIACWIFGILSSAISVFLFYRIQLYAESMLYIYYVLIGIYGYWIWSTKGKESDDFKISDFGVKSHITSVSLGILLALGLGSVLNNYTEADSPFLDSFTTIFSFIASYLQAKKVLSSFIYWIIINAVTLYLYINKELEFYFFLTIVYLVFSFIGYRTWREKMALQCSN